MTKEEITKHVHYKPAKYAPVCGIYTTIKERKEEPDTSEYPLSLTQNTTNFQNVTCPKCREWIKAIVSKW